MLKAKEKQKLNKELGNGAGEIKPHTYLHVQFFKYNIRIFKKIWNTKDTLGKQLHYHWISSLLADNSLMSQSIKRDM